MAIQDKGSGEPHLGGRPTGLFRTKSIEQSIRDTDEPETKLRKDLTAWDLTVFGVAVVIGAGIFTLTARTAGNVAGPSVSVGVRDRRHRVRARRALLRRVRLDRSGRGQRVHVLLRDVR